MVAYLLNQLECAERSARAGWNDRRSNHRRIYSQLERTDRRICPERQALCLRSHVWYHAPDMERLRRHCLTTGTVRRWKNAGFPGGLADEYRAISIVWV